MTMMPMRFHLVWILALALLAGCYAQPYVTEERMDKGLVIVLSGIEGRGLLNEAICKGLDEGGVNCAIRLVDWTTPFTLVFNLANEAGNRQKAEGIARRIVEYRYDYPGRPVVLVGQSGGAAMAAWTAEVLPAGKDVDGIVMLVPSLSPEYMLDWALKKSKGGIVSFYSEHDWMLLSTTLSGTMDGQFTASAGRTGFVLPKASDPVTYEKLNQIPWDESVAWSGYTGGHFTSGAHVFVAEFVAPFVLDFATGQFQPKPKPKPID